jgi:uncharacterized LabA/DUF88 family protein
VKEPQKPKKNGKKLNTYFERIKETELYEVRLGRLIKDGSGSYKQKGVDVSMAIDMLTKAYESHYDVAVLLAGDDSL